MPKIKPGKKQFEKILLHPDRNLIIRLLARGDGVRSVENILKEKYPDDKSKTVTFMTLQKFRKDYMNLEAEALSQLKKEEKDRVEKKEEIQIDKSIRNLPSYKQVIENAKEEHIDIRKTLKNLELVINSRIETLFNLANDGKLSEKREENFLGYMEKQLSVLEKWGKYVEKIADKTIQTDVNITVVQDQAILIREAILETLDDISPELKIKFLENLNKKLENTVFRKKKTASIGNISSGAHEMLNEYIDTEISDD